MLVEVEEGGKGVAQEGVDTGRVVCVEDHDGEEEGGDEDLEEGDEEVLGDVGDRAEVLEPGHFVDDVDDVYPLLALAVTEVHGVRPAGGRACRRARAADRCRPSCNASRGR